VWGGYYDTFSLKATQPAMFTRFRGNDSTGRGDGIFFGVCATALKVLDRKQVFTYCSATGKPVLIVCVTDLLNGLNEISFYF
jgi:hypothetical protein